MGDTEVNVEGDAVVNEAPDGGGVDNNAENAGSGEDTGTAAADASESPAEAAADSDDEDDD